MWYKNYVGITVILPGVLVQPATMLAQDEVYGWQLMSEQERAEHYTKIQSMKTEEERNRYRYEHHQKMLQRARQQGVTLPDMPGDRLRDHDRDMDRMHDGSGSMGGGGKR